MNVNKSPRRIDRKAGGRNKKIIIKKFIGPINANDLQLIKDKINEN